MLLHFRELKKRVETEDVRLYRGPNMIFNIYLDWKISLLYPNQISEPYISGVCVSVRWPHFIYTIVTTQTPTIPFAFPISREASDHQCSRSPQEGVREPLHAQEQLLNSSSWVDPVPNFRQEIRQSHYRNDPVKYDLNMNRNFPLTSLLPTRITFANMCY